MCKEVRNAGGGGGGGGGTAGRRARMAAPTWGSMPNSSTSLRLVLTATMCLATASWPSSAVSQVLHSIWVGGWVGAVGGMLMHAERSSMSWQSFLVNHSQYLLHSAPHGATSKWQQTAHRTVRALSIVSVVVNVLEITITYGDSNATNDSELRTYALFCFISNDAEPVVLPPPALPCPAQLTRVVSGWRPLRAFATSTGSTLARNRSFLHSGHSVWRGAGTRVLRVGLTFWLPVLIRRVLESLRLTMHARTHVHPGTQTCHHWLRPGAPAPRLVLAALVILHGVVNEQGAQVGAANADGHHVGQGLAGGAQPLAAAHALCAAGG